MMQISDGSKAIVQRKLSHTIRVLVLKAWLNLAFSVLTALSNASPPFPQRTCQRFASSAAKRDPNGTTVPQIVDIMAAGTFDREYCFGSDGTRMRLIPAIRAYLFRSSSGVDPRKPEPSFHPDIFAQAALGTAKDDVDPYVTFLRQGRPLGPWLSPIIEGGTSDVNFDPQLKYRVALHIHAYYIDQVADIVERLNISRSRPDLFVSIKDKGDIDHVATVLRDYGGLVSEIAAFPNLGRDIGPMLTGFGSKLLNGYDIIGHVHTKGSLFANNSKWVANWSNLALSNSIGGQQSGPMVDRILNAMLANPRTGIVYPSDPHIPGWGVNKAAAQELGQRLGLSSLPAAFNFPIGTMFWIRSDALRPFVELDLKWRNYPTEPIPNDGTMLHALERLFGVVPDQNGWETMLTHTTGVVR